jgi:hypothetical protein
MHSPHLVIGSLLLTTFLALAASAPGCGGLTAHNGATGGPPEAGPLVEAGPLTEAAASAEASPIAEVDPRSLSCPESPPALQAGGTLVTFQTDPVLGGRAMIYGQPNALPGGGTLTPLNLRFFLSNVALVRGDGTLVPVDLVTAAGTPERYGIHFFNAEDPPSTAWTIRAPAGPYRGMSLVLGMSDVCDANRAVFSADTQMTWPSPFGYLFLRFESRVDGVSPDGGGPSGSIDGGVPPVDAIAMGGIIGSLFAPIVHVDQLLTVPAVGPILRHLRLDMDQVFKGASANIDVSSFVVPPPPGGSGGFLPSFDEMKAGERLRRTAPQLPLFIVDP